MTYKGHIENGVIVLGEPTELPEGATVNIEITSPEDTNADDAPPFAERYAEVMGKAKTLPKDAAENHDHYRYGTPIHAIRN
jgi:hypothetical protein